MNNHSDKARDMARAVLASSCRDRARRGRRFIHHRERQQVRTALRRVLHGKEDADLRAPSLRARVDIAWLVEERRESDRAALLGRWAIRRVATNRRLTEADFDARMADFRRILPDDTIGLHALAHIWWTLHFLERQREDFR